MTEAFFYTKILGLSRAEASNLGAREGLLKLLGVKEVSRNILWTLITDGTAVIINNELN